FAGHGQSRMCSGCAETIGPSDEEYEAHYADGRTYYFHLGCGGLWHAHLRGLEPVIDDAKRIRERSQATRERARATAKESAQLRDQAQVLRAESEEAIEKARRAQRGEQPRQ